MPEWTKDIRNPLVKELIWSISSPQILHYNGPVYSTLAHDWWIDKIEQNSEFYFHLDKHPSLLESALRPFEHIPLGKRHELFIRFFLEHTPSINLILHSFQIIEKNKTLGEIDFIFSDQDSGITYQLEVACKFFLQHKRSKNWNNFIGPNGNDKLENRVEKTIRQLTLSNHEQVQNHLINIPHSEIIPVASLRGFIFHHYKQLSKALTPKSSTKNYNAGWYCFENEMPQFFANNNYWSITKKRSWLAPIHLELDAPNVMSSEDTITLCKTQFKLSKHSIALVQLEATSKGFVEMSRGFVVHNSWPNLK